MIEIITNTCVTACGIAIVVCLIGTIRFAAQMWVERKPGVESSEVAYNRCNICIRTDLLTEAGLKARGRYFKCMIGLMVSISAIIVLAALR